MYDGMRKDAWYMSPIKLVLLFVGLPILVFISGWCWGLDRKWN